jgi:hypothetical protein
VVASLSCQHSRQLQNFVDAPEAQPTIRALSRRPCMIDEVKNQRRVPLSKVIYGLLSCVDGRDEGM